ncbi:hypothetical protein [Holospora curviuscula]|uniref:Uncharacterized protein n=1 Tax=Holospora curviuscula TaxID=1082868 RepID=A0A2S5R7G4_9PROT|nr:hypothetical protein [Holospora curviuscula]PPE03281.1 hypothetical protein HCUR_01275 [Holospora curviuscula]
MQCFSRGAATLSDTQRCLRRYRVWKNHASVCKKRSYLNKTIEISEPQDGLRSPKDKSLNKPLLGLIIIQDCLKRTKFL